MSDLYIIAAGKGSRMGGSIPKALVPITDQPNLTTTLQQIGHKFNNVFVVTNFQIQTPWFDYFDKLAQDFPELAKNVHHVQIYSGRGDGHAVLEALMHTHRLRYMDKLEISDDIVIAWGDVFFPHAEIIDEMLEKRMDMGIIPVAFESEPYVAIRTDSSYNVLRADFSKLSENTRDGFHDQSVFRFERNALLQALGVMDTVLNKGGTYITTNGEMSLLHVFHYVHNTGGGAPEIQAYETNFPTMSFNTVEEVAQIQQEIDKKWKHKFRKDPS